MTFKTKIALLACFFVGFAGKGFSTPRVIDVLDKDGQSFAKQGRLPLKEILPGAPEGFSYTKQPDGAFQIVEMLCTEGRTFKNYAPLRDRMVEANMLLATCALNGGFLDNWTNSGFGASHIVTADGRIVHYIPTHYKPQMAAQFNSYTSDAVVVVGKTGTVQKAVELTEAQQAAIKKIAGDGRSKYFGSHYEARGSYVDSEGKIIQGNRFSSGNVDLGFLTDSGLQDIRYHPDFKKLVEQNAPPEK